MDLKDFVRETIKEIADGIAEGHKHVIDTHKGSFGVDSHSERVKFDVAVTTNEEKIDGVNGGIAIAKIFSVSGKQENTASMSSISRVQFSVFLHINTSNKGSNIR